MSPPASRARLFVRSVLFGSLVSLLVFVLSSAGFLRRWENGVFDFLMWWENEKRSTEIFLIEIDSADYRDVFRGTSPLSRRVLADVLTKLALSKPKAVALDIGFDIRTDEDPYLIGAQQTLESGGVPLVIPVSAPAADQTADPLYDLRGSAVLPPAPKLFAGVIEYPVSDDGVIREMPVLKSMEKGGVLPCFPLAVAAAATGMNWEDFQAALRLPPGGGEAGSSGSVKIRAIVRSGGVAPYQNIRFIGDRTSFNALRISQIAAMPEASFRAPNIFTDKIILLGGVFKESKDFYPTPKGMMSGVEIIANSVETLLNFNPIRPVNHIFELLFELLVVLALSFIFYRFSPPKATLLSLAAVLPISILGSAVAFTTLSRWLNFIPAALGVFFHGEFSFVEHHAKLKAEVDRLEARLREKDEELARLRTPEKPREESSP